MQNHNLVNATILSIENIKEMITFFSHFSAELFLQIEMK